MFDVTVLTERRYANPSNRDGYIKNILHEDQLVVDALQRRGLTVTRKSWDDADFDWSTTRFALFRTTWDYFDRFTEFETWFNATREKTKFIHSADLIHWNMDKHYLLELAHSGINIAPTSFYEPGEDRTLDTLVDHLSFEEFIIKPAIAGTARHTYRFMKTDVHEFSERFRELVANESMLIQEYQNQITTKGELSLILFGGEYSHAVLKQAKSGDFRVQDDFGGSVHQHQATQHEIEFAKRCIAACPFETTYARVDISWDNSNELYLAELELIEPELWFRNKPPAAEIFAEQIVEHYFTN